MNDDTPSELVIARPAAALGDYRRMNLWLLTHSKKSRSSIAILVLASVGGFVAAVAMHGSRYEAIASLSYDIFVGALLAIGAFAINIFVLAPRRARRLDAKHADHTYTFSADGIAYAGPHSSGIFRWNTFAGFVSRPDAVYVVVDGASGALLFPRRMLTPESARRLESIVGAHLSAATRI